jgi:hypothetical protein
MGKDTSVALLSLARDAVRQTAGWHTVEQTDRWIQVVPDEIANRLPPIGESGRRSARDWLTLEFWIQDSSAGLGMFWWVNPVIDLPKRNATLDRLFADARTGFVRKSVKDWRALPEFAIAGETISSSWWPKGGTPSLSTAAAEIKARISEWNHRVGAMAAAIGSPDVLGREHGTPSVKAVVSKSLPSEPRSPTRVSGTPAQTTPLIPTKFRKFRAQPHYTSIFEIYPDETHIYGTEDWHGDWSARVLFMAKDAGSSRIFKPVTKGGRGWKWITNHSRPTNRNLRPLIDSLPGGKLYGSFLGPLLRNDDQESGELVIDESIRAFVQDLFQWTVSQMPHLETVAVLGKDAWRELMLAIDLPEESSRWKVRHLSGKPLLANIAGRTIHLVALNHPARIVGPKLMQQPGWRWISYRYNG